MKKLSVITLTIILSLSFSFAQGNRWNHGGNEGQGPKHGERNPGFGFSIFQLIDSLEESQISGTIIVDSGTRFEHFLLDTDNDDSADYLLHFGPRHRIDSTKTLPADGDQIDIKGYIFTPDRNPLNLNIDQLIFVTELNGETWFEVPELTEYSGKILFSERPDSCQPPEEDRPGRGRPGGNRPDKKIVQLDTDENGTGDYVLAIGGIPADSLFTDGENTVIEAFEIEPLHENRCVETPILKVVKVNGNYLPAPPLRPGGPNTPPRGGRKGDHDPVMKSESGNISSRPFPNPFNPTVTISYSLKEPGQTSVEIYNIQGQKIKKLSDEYKAAGSYQVQWDGRNTNGSKVATGTYFYIIRKGVDQIIRKIQFIK